MFYWLRWKDVTHFSFLGGLKNHLEPKNKMFSRHWKWWGIKWWREWANVWKIKGKGEDNEGWRRTKGLEWVRHVEWWYENKPAEWKYNQLWETYREGHILPTIMKPFRGRRHHVSAASWNETPGWVFSDRLVKSVCTCLRGKSRERDPTRGARRHGASRWCVKAGGMHWSESAGSSLIGRQMRSDYIAVKRHIKGNASTT